MLQDLTEEQRMLADFMSELSEEAYCAGWMDGLEFALWEALTEERASYGRLEFDETQVNRLRALSSSCGGWIVFEDIGEETWIPLRDWTSRFAEWKAGGGRAL
jgi:hypothetical protein